MARTTKIIESVLLWEDRQARQGPAQMACDELLMENQKAPLLRVFRWDGPCVSIGYFADAETAARSHPGLPLCRRWTGGGLVLHDGDFTYSLSVPKQEKLAVMKPSESYRLIHSALAKALRDHGVETSMFETASPSSSECFAAAVQHDLVAGVAKIAGGAQRRSCNGLLHQGSVQCRPAPGREFGLIFARALADSVGIWTPPAGFEEQVEGLVRKKYAAPAFLRGPRRPKNFTEDTMS